MKQLLFFITTFFVFIGNFCVNAQQYKTFEMLKSDALFMLQGHDNCIAFADKEIKIIKVTNLDKWGEGSLSAAINVEGPRIVVFEVGGVINLDNIDLDIRIPYLYIAGQTAPSPGITIIKGGLSVSTHDVIIQHISVRPGDCGLPPKCGWEADGLTTFGAYNVLIDHCSFTWATDENLSTSGPRYDGENNTSRNITFSNNIIAECLYESTHAKTIHSMGTLIHDYCRNIAVVGNIYAHNNQRNPMIKPNVSAFIANNLIYNSKDQSIHATWPLGEYAQFPDSMRRAKITAIGNVLIPGVDTKTDMYLLYGKLSAYQKNNKILRNVNDKQGYKPEYVVSPDVEELDTPPVNAEHYGIIDANEVAYNVLNTAGARPKMRDAIDSRIIDDIKSGKGKIINSQEEVGGYPDYQPVYRPLSIPEKQVEKWLSKLSNELIHDI